MVPASLVAWRSASLVGRDGDDRVGDGLAQVGLGVGLEESGQDAGADLLGGVLLAVDLDGPVGLPMWRLTREVRRSAVVTAWQQRLADEDLASLEGPTTERPCNRPLRSR